MNQFRLFLAIYNMYTVRHLNNGEDMISRVMASALCGEKVINSDPKFVNTWKIINNLYEGINSPLVSLLKKNSSALSLNQVHSYAESIVEEWLKFGPVKLSDEELKRLDEEEKEFYFKELSQLQENLSTVA